MKLIDDAFDPILKFFKDTEVMVGTKDKPVAKYPDVYSLPPAGYTSNIRLDWESFSWDMQPVNLDLMFAAFKCDLWDILLNGDVCSDDAILRYADGIKKRGKYIKSLELGSAKLYTEFKPSKDTIEYTLYLRVFIEWEDE